MKKSIALFLMLTLIFALAACGGKAELPTEIALKGKIGISLPSQSVPRWERDGSDMKAQLEEIGYAVDLEFAGDNDIPTQIAQLEEMISGGCDVLVIAAIDGSMLTDVLKGAKEKEIPVIAYDRMIQNTSAHLYYASYDNSKAGALQVNFILDALGAENAEGPFNIEIFSGDLGDSNWPVFYMGGIEVLQPYLDAGKLVVKSGQVERNQNGIEGWSTEKAQKRMKELISSQGYGPEGEKLDAVWCLNDSIAQGVTQALLDAGYTAGKNFPVITGQDCDSVSVKNILAGTQSMSIYKDTRDLTSRTVTMVDEIMKGGEPEVNDTETFENGLGTKVPAYLCDPVVCTAKNYKELLIESGYYTEDELTGNKSTGKKVGISLPNQLVQRFEEGGSGMKAQLEEAGYEVEVQYSGDNDIPTQISQLEAMISGGCGVLVIEAIDEYSLTDVLKKAKEKGIPVISYERLIMDSDAVSYYVSFDNSAVGSLQASYIAESLNLSSASGPFNMELFTGDQFDVTMPYFYTGAMKIFQPYLASGKLVVPSGQIERDKILTEAWSTEKAEERMKTLIASQGYGPNGKKLDAVWCANDSVAQGVTKALLDAGYIPGENFPIITGQDCDFVSVKNLLDGSQRMSVWKDTRKLVSRAVAMVNALMKGEEPEVNNTADFDNGLGTKIPTYLCEPDVCVKENYKELLIDSGFLTEDMLH